MWSRTCVSHRHSSYSVSNVCCVPGYCACQVSEGKFEFRKIVVGCKLPMHSELGAYRDNKALNALQNAFRVRAQEGAPKNSRLRLEALKRIRHRLCEAIHGEAQLTCPTLAPTISPCFHPCNRYICISYSPLYDVLVACRAPAAGSRHMHTE